MDPSEDYALSVLRVLGINSREELWRRVNQPDRNADFELYEAAVIQHYKLIPWKAVPQEFCAKHQLPRNSNDEARDIGVDAISIDEKSAVQMKWYGPKSYISYRNISTFFTTSCLMNAQNRLLVTPPDVRVRSECPQNRGLFSRVDFTDIHVYTVLVPLLVNRIVEQPSTVVEQVSTIEKPSTVVQPAKNVVVQSSTVAEQSTKNVVVQSSTVAEQSTKNVVVQSSTVVEQPAENVVVQSSTVVEQPAENVVVQPSTVAKQPAENVVVQASTVVEQPVENVVVQSSTITEQSTVVQPSTVEQAPTIEKIVDVQAAFGQFTARFRDYQIDAWKNIYASKDAHVLCRMACGAGKSWVIVAAACSHPYSVVVFVSTVILQRQLQNLFRSIGVETGIVGGGQCSYGKITICIYNSIDHIQTHESTLVLCDEGHHVLLNTDADAGYLQKCYHTPGRHVYFTATAPETDIPRVADVTMALLIERKLLSDYCIWIPHFSGDNHMQETVDLVVENPQWSRILAYCNRVDDCRLFAEMMNAKNINTAIMGADLNIDERMSIIEQFEDGKINCIASVNTIKEAMDAPSANTCLFVDPRNSKISIAQCIGRVVRLCESKTIAHVVLPGYTNPQLKKFLVTMIDDDIRLQKSIENREPGKISFTHKRQDVSETYMEVYSSVGVLIAGQWYERLEELKAYVAQHNALPPKSSSMGMWCQNQRQFKKKNKLSQDRIQKLETIPGWYWEMGDLWERKYEELKAYVAQHNALPPYTISIGSWCDGQRQNKKKNKLSQDRIQKLEAIPCWFWDKFSERWALSYEELKAYVAQHNVLPTQSTSIGAWCTTQRQNKKKNKLSQDQIQKLETIPCWYWELDLWTPRYEELKAYVAQRNAIPSESISIGMWCGSQRRKKNKLSQDQIQKLEAIPGWFWEMGDLWTPRYEELKAYVAQHNALPPSHISIGIWCSTQRQFKKKNKLSQDQIQKLEAMPYWYWELWTHRYEELKAYIAQHNALPPYSISLGSWCNNQRQNKKKNKLSQDQIQKLEAIPGWFWSR